MGIFDKRVALKPYEYPEVLGFVDAINQSYWVHSEFNFKGDVQDFRHRLLPYEQTVIKKALLAISQIEVSVKTFWGKLGDRFPKPEFNAVGTTFAECHVEGTEILTPRGWVDFRDIALGDPVYEYHPNGTLSATTVQEKIARPYQGPVYEFRKTGVAAVVTPNHRMVFFQRSAKGIAYREETAEKLQLTNTACLWPESARLVGGTVTELSPMDQLRLAIQADGNRRYYRNPAGERVARGWATAGAEYEIRVQKPRKKERMDEILARLPEVVFSKRDIPSRPGMVCYTIKIDSEYDYKQLAWVDLTDKTAVWCEAFVQELAEWDGTRLPTKKACKLKYSSVEKSVVDVVQAVGTAAGYKVRVGAYEDNRKATHRTCYVVSFVSGRERVTFSPAMQRTQQDYQGMVYCVSVPSGAILTRYQNHTFIAGNCEVRHERAYSFLLEKLGLDADFDNLLTVPAIQGRVDYLTKYMRGAADNSRQNYTLTLALFSLFIENVSLFSQFAIVKSFSKHRNMLGDIDNVIQATMKEETLHAKLGTYLINQVRQEHPEWFNEEFYRTIERACRKAFDAEVKILDWIFEEGELEFARKDVFVEFIRHRFNESLIDIGGRAIFEPQEEKLNALRWLMEEIDGYTDIDFFSKKSTNYSKSVQSYSASDLF